MNRLRFLFQKILVWFRIRAAAAGLEITDQVLRLVHFDGKVWQLNAIRLEPGVLENGRIKDREKFLVSLAALKAQSKVGGGKKKKVSVVVSLSSVNAYSQMFNLPAVAREELTKAVELNVAMASPGEAEKTYSSWQIVGKDEDAAQINVLSSFMDRETVDEMVEALFEVNFFAMAVEPRSIALARILREKGLGAEAKKAYILVDVDVAGMDFLVIRNGEPYFEYTNRWAEVADEKGNIPLEKFKSQLTMSLRQVSNFYSKHWQEPIAAVIISSVVFQEEIEKTVAQNFSLPTLRMTLEMGQTISPEWLIAIGCALRGRRTKFEFGEREISLLGEPWEERFQSEQMVGFLNFWRVLVPVVMGILVLIFVVADSFLVNTKTSIETEAKLTGSSSEVAQLADLEASSTQFNAAVAMIQNLEQSSRPMSATLNDIVSLAATSQISIRHLSVQAGGTVAGGGTPITLSGSATSEDRILAFKGSLESDAKASAIDLPLTQIQQNGNNFTFTMTFAYAE